MELFALGGSGEQGRACFGVIAEATALLLDAGVRREPAAPPEAVYPFLDAFPVDPRAVLLSHAHEDHCAALPLVQRRSEQPVPIYATAQTASAARQYCLTWMATVEAMGKRPPFDRDDVAELPFRAIRPGSALALGPAIRCTFGPAGHLPGSCWFMVEAGGRRLLYTGDWSSESSLLRRPTFPGEVDAVLLDASYGDQTMAQADQVQRLLTAIRSTASAGGVVLLPVPRLGRGQEMLLALASRAEELPPIHVEATIVQGLECYRASDDLSADGQMSLGRFDRRLVREFAGDPAEPPRGPSIWLAPDGMLSGGPANALFERLADDEANLVVLSGHQAAGTLGARLLANQSSARRRARATRITWKVHPDLGEIRRLLTGLRGRPRVFPVHADRDRAQAAAVAIGRLGFETTILEVGESCQISSAGARS